MLEVAIGERGRPRWWEWKDGAEKDAPLTASRRSGARCPASWDHDRWQCSDRSPRRVSGGGSLRTDDTA